jgi:preprotein translocase subunit SecG
MHTVLVVIHIMLAIALIGVILLQRSEGGGLGIGSSGGMGGFMTARGTANLLTRATAGLAAAFMLTSIVLAIFAGAPRERQSIIDNLNPAAPSPAIPGSPAAPAPVAPSAPAAPAEPAAPSAPIAR